MLDGLFACGAPPSPFLSPVVVAHVASEPWHFAAYDKLRRLIFVEEQRLFESTDEDGEDAVATPIVALGQSAGMFDQVIGVVRIYPAGNGVWFGGRLGVDKTHRSRGIVGTSLICAAVCTAHAWGCRRFLATIQTRNVPYFEQHRFEAKGSVLVCGTPHCLMEAALDAYPAVAATASNPIDGSSAAARFQRARAA